MLHGVAKKLKQKKKKKKESAYFSAETSQARIECCDILQVLKEKDSHPILYLATSLFRIEIEIKSFPDKQKPKELITTKQH